MCLVFFKWITGPGLAQWVLAFLNHPRGQNDREIQAFDVQEFCDRLRCFLLHNNSSKCVRKHLIRGFRCAVLDLSGTLWPLLIPEYSGIKRRGAPFPGLRNPGISRYSDKYPLPSYEKVVVCNSLFDRDHLKFCKSGILIFIFVENNYLVRQYICPCHVD